jgi:glycosyltransferase involved in cell wall biosynthesis
MPLTIGVDARELLGDATGVGRYLGELMRRWVRRPDARRRRFVMYAPERLLLHLPAGAAEQRIIGRGGGTLWEQTSLRRRVGLDRPDVFFAPAYTAPLGLTVPLAVTIHDVSFSAHPEWFRFREGLRRRFLTTRAAQSASVIFTVSEFSRAEIETHLGVPRSRIEVIPQGVNVRIQESGVRRQKLEFRSQETGDRANAVPTTLSSVSSLLPPATPSLLTPNSPLVLYVGSIFNRRRLPDLIAAFARATRDMPGARLAIVGADRTWPRQDLRAVARTQGVASRVALEDYVSEEQLASLYAQASVFAFLSEYEGFGLTPLEALAAGVPVVALDTPVAREVYADAVAYVQPHDIVGTAEALRRIMTSPAEAERLLARAPAVVARYSWDRAADRTLEHLERIAAR